MLLWIIVYLENIASTKKTNLINLKKIISEYKLNGYSIIRNIIPLELALEIEKHVKWLKKKNPNIRAEAFHHHMLINDPFIHHIIEQKNILDVIEAIIGPDIALFGAHYIAKKPLDGMPVGWHQDGSYWPLKPMNVISVWLAGTTSKKNNACMRVIPGTQNKKLLKPSEMKKVDLNKYVLDLAIKADDLKTAEAIDLELNPGDMSIHNPFIVHGSNTNRSSKWRIGLTLRYIPTNTYVKRKNWECALLRGSIKKEIKNNYVRRPYFNHEKHMKFNGYNRFLN